MRTKTLLIAAAALAVGVASSLAQTTYSQNVVGYVNMTIPAHSYQIVGNTMINGSDANATNGDINTCFSAGFVSDPTGPPTGNNSVAYIWTGSGYLNYYYFNAADATTWEGFASPAGWYDAGGSPAAVNLYAGKAAFIQNPSAGSMTVTLTGNVLQGTNSSSIASGYNLISLMQPISTNVNVAAYGLPANLTSDPTGPPTGLNDVLYSWTGSGYLNYYWFNAADATTWEGFASPAGFYDAGGSPLPSSSNPAVNQGFFLLHNGSAIPWTTTFEVQ